MEFCACHSRIKLGRLALALLSVLALAAAPPALGAAEPDIRRDATVTAIERVMPSVVNIATETVLEYHEWYDDLLRQFYGWQNTPRRQQKYISLGSGVIIDEDGYVLTNYHVVRRASRVQVKLWDGREYDAEPLVATAASDLALLRIKAKPGEKFKAIKFAADDDLLLGETVLALGNPFGLGMAVTKGILSSKNRRPATGDEPLKVEDWLQTDATINPGNSGGPLVNLRGELIGVNVAVARQEEGMGMGFSIPVKQVAAALSGFCAPEVTDSLWFGAQLKGGPGPLVVSSVQAGSPAAKAGLRVNDEALEVNGRKAATLISCNHLLCLDTNHTASLKVARGTERPSLSVKLVPFEDLIQQKLGLTLLEVTPQTAQRLGIRAGENLYIEQVEKGGPAERAQLQPGYLLRAIDGQSAAELRAVTSVLTQKQKGDAVHLTVVVPRRLGASYVQFQQGTVDVVLR
jgi:serine protease Do